MTTTLFARAEALGLPPEHLHCDTCTQAQQSPDVICHFAACSVDGVVRQASDDCPHPEHYTLDVRPMEARYPWYDWLKLRNHTTVAAQLRRVEREHAGEGGDTLGGLTLHRDSRGPALAKGVSDAA